MWATSDGSRLAHWKLSQATGSLSRGGQFQRGLESVDFDILRVLPACIADARTGLYHSLRRRHVMVAERCRAPDALAVADACARLGRHSNRGSAGERDRKAQLATVAARGPWPLVTGLGKARRADQASGWVMLTIQEMRNLSLHWPNSSPTLSTMLVFICLPAAGVY